MHGVNRQRETLGKYPTISLKQARDKAKQLMAQITLGIK
ncbi:Arm DNA-binding domain-containing protein [Amylibacter sp. SFDW26]|nr:Arm DNA-binding domain-containing protein [Amylibacter sp. SFDW26]